MSADIFGNLMEWGKALQALDELKRAGRLDEHQPGLVRILRYRDNWRLREAVLGCLDKVTNPCRDLVKEVLNIATDKGTYHEARVLAIQALPCLVDNFKGAAFQDGARMRDSVVQCMEAMSDCPQPLIHQAARESCNHLQHLGLGAERIFG